MQNVEAVKAMKVIPIGASDLVSGTNAAPATVDELESILRVLAPILADPKMLEPATP
jgi:hypothetical protein